MTDSDKLINNCIEKENIIDYVKHFMFRLKYPSVEKS